MMGELYSNGHNIAHPSRVKKDVQMPKRTLQQEERRLWDSGQADINEHERIVTKLLKIKNCKMNL
jgi:hypothetical protein